MGLYPYSHTLYPRTRARASFIGKAQQNRRALFMRQVQRSGRSRTLTNRRHKFISGQGVTDHYDRKLIYRKKNMPRRRKRRWIKYIKKVDAASEKDLGTRTVVFNDKFYWDLIGTDNDGLQIRAQIALYPCKSTVPHLTDVSKMLTDPSLSTTSKVIMKSAVLDITGVNNSYTKASDNAASVPWTVELDCYEISCSQDFESQIGNFNLVDAFVEGATDTASIAIPGSTGLTLSNRGVSPWDLPSALSEFGIKIWKKTKYELGPGKSFTYQVRDSRRRVLDKAKYEDYKATNIPGYTRWLLMIIKLVPGYPSGSIYNYCRVDFGITRKYSYKVKEQSGDADALLAS